MKIQRCIPLLLAFVSFQFAACDGNLRPSAAESAKSAEAVSGITEQDVLDAQQAWGEGIVTIGLRFSEGGDYVGAAGAHIDRFYGYGLGPVLFKPTLASEKQFRTTREGALSYFVAGNPGYPEDHGFALKPWSRVRWESAGILSFGASAVAMGNYYFTPAAGGDEVKVEYSFAYTRDAEGALRIVLHGSHLPYRPTEGH